MGARSRPGGGRAALLSARPPVPPLHLVATDEVARRADFPAIAAELLAAAGPALALHLRLPEAPGAALYALASRLAPLAADAGALLVVNDRVDVALAARCSGVQLGARGMTAGDARGLLGHDRLIGASVHTADEARAAGDFADFLLVGTIFASETHPGRPGAGPRLLAEMRGVRVPMIAIGGITPPRVGEVRAAGASGVAVVQGIWGAPSPRGALLDYLTELAGR